MNEGDDVGGGCQNDSLLVPLVLKLGDVVVSPSALCLKGSKKLPSRVCIVVAGSMISKQ